MEWEKPLPIPDADSRPFWEGCREHRLMFQKCAECGKIRWPPGFVCPECYSQKGGWIESSGRGKIYTYAVYHQAFHPAFKEDLPYVVAIVELAEGPLILTNIIHCGPDRLKCDLPVEVVWDDVTKDLSLPKFKPTPDGGDARAE